MGRKMFVGGLPYDATVSDLQLFFTDRGISVESCNLVNDKETGLSRGFGFVTVQRDFEIKPALALDGSLFFGKRIRVSEARSPADRRVDQAPKDVPQKSQWRKVDAVDGVTVPRNVWIDVSSYTDARPPFSPRRRT
jgi:RNA recognition motif-containing protein